MGWRELFWKSVRQLCCVLRQMRSPVANLKLGSCVDRPYVLLGVRKLLENSFLSNEPLHKKLAFRKLNPSLILDLPYALYSVYTPSVGMVGLAEYVCTHPFPNFYR